MLKQQLSELGVGWQQSGDAQTQATLLAADIIAVLSAAISQRGHASLAVSGGRSPVRLLEQLEHTQLEWEKVTITLVDERWVPPTDEHSNAGLIQRCMPGVLQRACWLPLYQGDSLQKDAQRAATELEALMPLDVVVLGMGLDGHTASLFPHMPCLRDWLSPAGSPLCVAVPAQGKRMDRLSMTASAIQTAGLPLLLMDGEQKRQALAKAIALGDPQAMPVTAFLKPPLDIYYSP